MRSKFLSVGLIAISAIVVQHSARATPVTGEANIAGNVTVQDGIIAFAPTFVATAGAMETGSFAGLTGGAIQTLTGGPLTGNLATPVVNFVNFNQGVATPVSFDLTFIAPGVGSLGACTTGGLGAECTPAGSPFTLIQLSSNTVVATLQMNGNAYTGSSASGVSPTTSVFSTQSVVNGTIPQIYATLVSGGAVSGVTYSASFIATSPIPEPASMLLMGIGLVGAGLVARRKLQG